MKKIAAIALFLGLISFSLKAQGDIKFGVHVSPSFSWIDSDDKFVNSNQVNLGLRLGLFGEYFFQENYSITSGIGFAFNQGGTLLYDHPGLYWTETEDIPTSIDTISADANLKHSIQYVEIPIGLKLRTREFGHFRGFAEPHLAFGFKSKALGTLTAKDINEEDINEEDLNIKAEVNGLAVSWGFGAGTEYSISSSTAIIAGVYYQRIFTDVTDNNGTIFNPDRGDEVNDIKVIGNSITIRLGVRF